MNKVVVAAAAAAILADATTTTAPEDVGAVDVAEDVGVGVDADVGGTFPLHASGPTTAATHTAKARVVRHGHVSRPCGLGGL